MHIVISAVSSARQPSGICRHAATLTSCLRSAREISRVTLLLGQWQVGYFRDALGLRDKAEIIVVNTKNTPYARNLWYFFRFPNLVRDLGADVVHLSFPSPIRRSAFPCPVVLSLHDLYPYDVPQNFGSFRVFFNRTFLIQCLRASDAIACSSNFTLDGLRLRAPELAFGKARRIYLSVALDPRHERKPAISTLYTRQFLLAVAQHRRNKNLAVLLSAFAELRQRHPSREQTALVIVGGTGPETDNLESLVQQLALSDHVFFKSGLSDAELCWLYRRCELLVVPSIIEGFCFPVIEGLRCGARVLCSNIPVLREIGGTHCRYFELDQDEPATTLARAMEAALQAHAPGPYLRDAFSESRLANEYQALYASLRTDMAHTTTHPKFASANPVGYDRYIS